MVFVSSSMYDAVMDLHRPKGMAITRWEDWTRPKKAYHWKPGRSAVELARAWFRCASPSMPGEVRDILQADGIFPDVVVQEAVPELVTPLPERGEGRNHDLWALCEAEEKKFTLCIEAKADEPFGTETVGSYWRSARNRQDKGERTGVPGRISAMLRMVGVDCSDADECAWAEIPYQLLTAVCGTALQAERDGSGVGVMVVHEFQTWETCEEKHQLNGKAFGCFVELLGGGGDGLCGPFVVADVQCYVGKVRSRVERWVD